MSEKLLDKALAANELGIRLEYVRGLPIWEASPVVRHQKAVDRIRTSLNLGVSAHCQCVHLADIYISFPDGSLKRPDISVFCHEPEEEDEAVTLIPQAVVEIVSQGYEIKDLEIGPSFYLSHGVKDVLVLDPLTLLVIHFRQDGTHRHQSPVQINLECGCSCTV
jgi:Uma2 family endonuclease